MTFVCSAFSQAFGGGIGCGAPRHFYHAADLLAAAIRKHGQAGFEKKQQARQQRESKKRQREGDAEQALAELQRAPRAPAPVAALGLGASSAAPIILVNDSHAPRTAAVVPQELAALRKSLLKLSKQALAFTMSSTEGRQLQPRLDVRAETSSFEARPLFLWAFQSSKKQLQAICVQRPSLFHATTAQRRAFSSLFDANHRQSLLTCSRLSVTLVLRLLCFRSKCAVMHPLRRDNGIYTI